MSISVYSAIKSCMNLINENDICLFSTGFISRYAYDIKDRKRNFYMLGSMGSLLSIAIGISHQTKERIILFDGDGSFLMGMNALSMLKNLKDINLLHIVFNNGVYASTGNQKIHQINFEDFNNFYDKILNNNIRFNLSGKILMEIECNTKINIVPRIGLLPVEIYSRFKRSLNG